MSDRDRVVREWNLQLVVGTNTRVLDEGRTFPNGRATRVAHFDQPAFAWR